MMKDYRFLICTGRVIHDLATVSAPSEASARAMVQRRIDLGEFDQESLEVSEDESKPLYIHFSPEDRPRILMRLPERKR